MEELLSTSKFTCFSNQETIVSCLKFSVMQFLVVVVADQGNKGPISLMSLTSKFEDAVSTDFVVVSPDLQTSDGFSVRLLLFPLSISRNLFLTFKGLLTQKFMLFTNPP